MALAYTPPGVTVQEVTSPSVSPLLAVPARVCLVGRAVGYQTKTEAVTLTGTTAVALTVPAGATLAATAIQKVMDATTPSLAPNGYTAVTDYTFDSAAKTIARVGTGIIPDGATVYVTFRYTVADYYTPIRLDNMADIEDRFGAAWNTAGTAINSRLSFAAQIAFENGAQEVVLLPLFYNNAGVRQDPTDAQAAASATWADNFVALRDIEDINVIVPVVGQADPSVGDSNQLNVIQAAQDHIKFMKGEQQYMVAVVGEDSSASNSVAQKATLRTHAATVAARYGGEVTEQIGFVSPAKYTVALPNSTGGELAVGGQYMAAAIAGMLAARPVSQTLTRKVVSGFKSVAEIRSKADKNTDATNGLMVIEQKGFNIICRHAITLSTASTIKSELSIVRAKHRVIESVRSTIDTQIIGQVIADGRAPEVVRSAVIDTLAALVRDKDIVDFSGVQARTLTLNPTHIEVRFSYLPAFPVNYVSIVFSLDLGTGELTLPSTTQTF